MPQIFLYFFFLSFPRWADKIGLGRNGNGKWFLLHQVIVKISGVFVCTFGQNWAFSTLLSLALVSAQRLDRPGRAGQGITFHIWEQEEMK